MRCVKLCPRDVGKVNCAVRKEKSAMRIGVVDVGGGLRGIYGAGVLDYCIDRGIRFDVGIGVSAGSANLASFSAGQWGRNYLFYADYAFRKQYMSLSNFVLKKSFIDMDYVYSTLSNSTGENPLNYKALCDNPMEFYIVATDAITGRARYFDKSDIQQDNYSVFKASSSIPFVCKPYIINGVGYFDGALSDPVPIKKAFKLGCDRVVVILTKPESELRNSGKDEKIAACIRKKYPLAAERLCRRARRYNKSVGLAREYANQGRALIVSPDNTCGVDTLTKDKNSLLNLYIKGYTDGRRIAEYLFLETEKLT